jgi:hypothetical protein
MNNFVVEIWKKFDLDEPNFGLIYLAGQYL